MKCEIMDRDQRIDDFLLEKLSPEDAEAFEIHLFGCPECFEELRVREQMVKLIKEERVTVVDDYARQRSAPQPSGVIKSIIDFFRFQRNIWIYAGAAAVLLIALLVSRFFFKPEVMEQYAANFTESPHLESMLQQAARASAYSIRIISPAAGENFKGAIGFRWKIEKDGKEFASPVDLKILNNKEALVHAVSVQEGQYDFTQKLSPGLYYWTLEVQDETLFLGKFFVNKPKA